MASDILAAVAIVISGIALWQTLRWRPRPLVQIEDTIGYQDGLHSPEPIPYRAVLVENHGNADAMDVKVWATYKGEQTYPSEAGPIHPGEHWRVYLGSVVPWSGEGDDSDMISFDPSLVADALVVVTWRQAPGFRVQRRELRLKHAV